MCLFKYPSSLRAKRSNPGTELTGKYSKTEISQTRLLRRYAPRNDEEGAKHRGNTGGRFSCVLGNTREPSPCVPPVFQCFSARRSFTITIFKIWYNDRPAPRMNGIPPIIRFQIQLVYLSPYFHGCFQYCMRQ